MRLTIEQYLNLAYKLAILVFLGVIAFSSKVEVKTGISEAKLNHALETQREEVLREIDLKIEENAFKNIEKVDSLMSDITLRDSLRRAVFRR